MADQSARRSLLYKPCLVVIAGLLFVSIIAACGGSDATLPPATAPTADSLPAALTPGANGLSNPLEALDPDTIVAAHEDVLVRIYEALLPSVVHIRVSQRIEPGETDSPLLDFPEGFFRQGNGSGFVWDENGHVVTNNHVVQGADSVTVVFADGAELEAEVIGTDPDSDLAALRLSDPKSDAPAVGLGDSGTLKVGQMTVAIGSPFGQEFTMTTGIVSALGRTIRSGDSLFSIPEAIQSDVAINPGNSGGPLLDRLGRVIGVNTQIISSTGVNSGVGFAVPIDTAKRVIPALIENGRYEYSWLGITGSSIRPAAAGLMDLPRDTGGALVVQVTVDSPADKAGLRGSDMTSTLEGVEYSVGGDVIVAIDGSAVDDMDDLIAFLSSKTRPGDKVTLGVIRDGELGDLEVTLGKRPDSDA